MNILKMLLMVFVVLTLTSCSWCTKTEYIDVPYEVKVPVKCIVPDANCNFDRNTSTEVISALVECIIDMKHNAQICK